MQMSGFFMLHLYVDPEGESYEKLYGITPHAGRSRPEAYLKPAAPGPAVPWREHTKLRQRARQCDARVVGALVMPDTVGDMHAQRRELLDTRYDPAGELARREHTLRQAAHSLHPPVEYLRLLLLIQEALRAPAEYDEGRDPLIP